MKRRPTPRGYAPSLLPYTNPMSWHLIVCCAGLALASVALALFIGLRWNAVREHSWLAGLATVASIMVPVRLMLSPCVALRWDVTDTRVVFLLPSRGAPLIRSRDNSGFVRLRSGTWFTTAYVSRGPALRLPARLDGPNGTYRFELHGDKLRLAPVST